MKLYEYAQLIRSKNAGPFMLTIDIIFPTDDVYMKVWKSGALETASAAEKGEKKTFRYLKENVLTGKPFPWE